MIIFYEPICYGMEHVPFNAGLISVVAAAFSNNQLVVLGEATHIEFLKKELNPSLVSKITWHQLQVPARHARFWERFWGDRKNLSMLQLFGLGRDCNHLILTSFSPSVLWALKTTKYYLLGKVFLQLVAHGGVSTIIGWRSKIPLARLLDLVGSMTIFIKKNVQFVILEKNIKDKIISILPSLENHLAVIEHPLPTVPVRNYENKLTIERPIRFGFLGAMTVSKGFSYFLDASSRVKEVLPGRAEFFAIGCLSNQDSQYNLQCLDHQPSDIKLDRDYFLELASTLDFVCFPYLEDHYQLSPSGVLLDAIALKKPVFASSFSTVTSLTATYGSIGILVDSPSAIASSMIEFISAGDYACYGQWVEHLEAIQESRCIHKLSAKFIEITKNNIS